MSTQMNKTLFDFSWVSNMVPSSQSNSSRILTSCVFKYIYLHRYIHIYIHTYKHTYIYIICICRMDKTEISWVPKEINRCVNYLEWPVFVDWCWIADIAVPAPLVPKDEVSNRAQLLFGFVDDAGNHSESATGGGKFGKSQGETRTWSTRCVWSWFPFSKPSKPCKNRFQEHACNVTYSLQDAHASTNW